jgi:hypothetical protein
MRLRSAATSGPVQFGGMACGMRRTMLERTAFIRGHSRDLEGKDEGSADLSPEKPPNSINNGGPDIRHFR